ncbi:hypothetical protein BJX63DRAFT_432282 [Aspergillus granulosus]|uniref:Uncharacterized protein n=1 Tax=Aspergillus granulosus TaxID=176169 RepID=A0ABR4HBY3_9EURO
MNAHGRPIVIFRMYSLSMARRRPPNYAPWTMRPFRRLGIAIWDNWRMYKVGLFDVLARQPVPTRDGGSIDGSGSVDRVDMQGSCQGKGV